MQRSIWWLPTCCVVFLVLGIAAAPQNLSKALDAQLTLARAEPGNPAVLNDLGNLLRLAGRLDQAREAYEQAIAADPEHAAAHFNLGLLYGQLGDERSAIRAMRRVVTLTPDNAMAHFQLGSLYEARGDDRQAIGAYARAFRLDPNLAFSEVNPQVIESSLITESLLESYRGGPSAPLAPNRYDDASRIAALMMGSGGGEESMPEPASQAEARAAAAAETPPPGAGETRRPVERSADVAPESIGEETADAEDDGRGDEGEAEAPEASRRLSAETLDRAPRPPTSAGGVVVPPRDRQDAARELPGSTRRPRSGDEGRRPVDVTPSAPGAGSRRPTYRPGVNSTGRLELRPVDPRRAGDGDEVRIAGAG